MTARRSQPKERWKAKWIDRQKGREGHFKRATWFHPLTNHCYASERVSKVNHILGTVIGDSPKLFCSSKLVLLKKGFDSFAMCHVLKWDLSSSNWACLQPVIKVSPASHFQVVPPLTLTAFSEWHS